MVKFVDLAYSSEEIKTQAPMDVDGDGAKYPWGLGVTLNDECLEKLGKSATDFTVDQELTVEVVLKVNEVSSRETQNGSDQTVRLTLTQIALPESEDDKAKKLYE